MLILLMAGCSKKSAPKQAEAQTESAPAGKSATPAAASEAAPAQEVDRQATLDRLTQALRKFAAEQRRVPKSLDELVATGYLPELPGAPSGKRYVFDENLRVTLK